MARIEPVTIKHRLATCPVCRYPLFAEVDVAVEVGQPELDGEGKARVYAHPKPERMRLSHECDRSDAQAVGE